MEIYRIYSKIDNSSNLIVGVFQVAKPKLTYKKTSSIYVIKNKNEQGEIK